MQQEPSAVDLQLFDRVESSPPGTFKIFHANRSGVEEVIQQHLANIDAVRDQIRHSVATRCFIEAVSLRLQVIDYWLRLFFDSVASAQEERQREFGRLVEQCQKLGLDQSLAQRLKKSNTQRVAAIHGFVIGRISYGELEEVATEFGALVIETASFVIERAGTVVTDRQQLAANPGAIVVRALDFIDELRSGQRY